MASYQSIVSQLSARFQAAFRPASPFELAKLEDLELPETILAFYRDHEPAAKVEGCVRLWPIEHLLEENEALVPGCYVAPHSYIVFASTRGGDSYCFDLASGADPRIVLISHEAFSAETTAAKIAVRAKRVAANLEHFLRLFLRGDIDQDCHHEPGPPDMG